METTSAESSIRAIVEARSRAVSKGYPDAIVEFVADNVVTLDVVPPLVSRGRQAS
jgi:ketosteroid isomerase-like protein